MRALLVCQISDLHVKQPGLLSYRRVDCAAMLERCVQEILRLRQQPDLVIATGDLVDPASPRNTRTCGDCPRPAHQVALDLQPGAALSYIMEPPGFQLHGWREEFGVVSHTVFIGDFAGPFPLRENGKPIV